MLGLFGSKTKALIIVDVQNDFAPGGALAVPKGDEVVPFINSVMGDYKIIVATKDWHPRNHCSFASVHPGKKIGDRVDLEDGSQLLWPDHCVQGSPGAEFVKGLEAGKVQKTFQKGIDPDIDSYSGLFDNGFKRDTGLAKHLKDNKVTEVAVVGLATDYTVKYTALDCKKAGFEVTLLRKGCPALNVKPDDEEKALAELRASGVAVK